MRNVSAAQAQRELMRVVDSFILSLVNGYLSSSTEPVRVDKGKVVAALVRKIPTSEVVDRRGNPDGTIYVLGQVPLDRIERAIEESRELDPRLRDYLLRNAGPMFVELARGSAPRKR